MARWLSLQRHFPELERTRSYSMAILISDFSSRRCPLPCAPFTMTSVALRINPGSNCGISNTHRSSLGMPWMVESNFPFRPSIKILPFKTNRFEFSYFDTCEIDKREIIGVGFACKSSSTNRNPKCSMGCILNCRPAPSIWQRDRVGRPTT